MQEFQNHQDLSTTKAPKCCGCSVRIGLSIVYGLTAIVGTILLSTSSIFFKSGPIASGYIAAGVVAIISTLIGFSSIYFKKSSLAVSSMLFQYMFLLSLIIVEIIKFTNFDEFNKTRLPFEDEYENTKSAPQLAGSIIGIVIYGALISHPMFLYAKWLLRK